MMNALVLWLAQGLGIGRIPVAPGTFGSVLGLLWLVGLLATRSVLLFVAGCILAGACSVVWSSRAERILGEKDPSSVVIDEIAAMPVCFGAWLAFVGLPAGHLPRVHELFTPSGGLWVAAIFIGFRIFDVAKPWPVRQSQALPGGWGITVDDLLAAVYVNLLTLAVWPLVGR